MNIEHLYALGGRTASDLDVETLRRELPSVTGEFIRLSTMWPLIGLELVLPKDLDESDMGVWMRWMTSDEIVDEARNAFPGIAALGRGYVPIGICLEGSGDPYFFRQKDGAVVRIPHEAAAGDELDEEQIEVVAPSVQRLVELAEIERAE